MTNHIHFDTATSSIDQLQSYLIVNGLLDIKKGQYCKYKQVKIVNFKLILLFESLELQLKTGEVAFIKHIDSWTTIGY